MQVRGPAAVFCNGAHASKFFAARDALTDFEFVERLRGQMAIEGEEFVSVAILVAQNYERAVIEGIGIVRKDVDNSVEWRAQRRAWLYEKIDAQVDGSPLCGGIVRASKRRGIIERAHFIVAANTHAHASAFHLAEDSFRERRRFSGRRIGAEKCTRYT